MTKYHTIKNFCKSSNISRERVRQIQSKALLKLKIKKPKALRDYLVG